VLSFAEQLHARYANQSKRMLCMLASAQLLLSFCSASLSKSKSKSKQSKRLNKTEGFVKPELAATLPVNGLTGSYAASSGPVGSHAK